MNAEKILGQKRKLIKREIAEGAEILISQSSTFLPIVHLIERGKQCLRFLFSEKGLRGSMLLTALQGALVDSTTLNELRAELCTGNKKKNKKKKNNRESSEHEKKKTNSNAIKRLLTAQSALTTSPSVLTICSPRPESLKRVCENNKSTTTVVVPQQTLVPEEQQQQNQQLVPEASVVTSLIVITPIIRGYMTTENTYNYVMMMMM